MKTNSRPPKRLTEAKTSRTAQRKGDSRAASCSEVERLKSELQGLTRRAAAKDRIIGELIRANEKIIASAPLTDEQRSELASYVAAYLERGVHGVWYELATGIAALMADNERLRNDPSSATCAERKGGA